MVVGCGATMVKYLMWIINTVLFLAGLILMISAMVIRFSDSLKQWLSDQVGFKFMGQLDTGLYAIMVAGAFVMCLSFLACCGAVAESKMLLGLFTLLMVVMVIVELVGLGMIVAFSGEVDTQLKGELLQKLKTAADIYDHKEEGKDIWKFWHFLQEKFDCCGVGGIDNSWAKQINATSQASINKIEDLKPEDVACKPENKDMGCYISAKEWLKGEASKVLGVISFFIILEVVSIAFAVFLCCRIGKGYKDIE